MPIRGDVSQISPPIRILLVLSIAVLGLYMLFLRPKAEVAPPAAPAPNVQTGAPAQTGAGKAVEAAQGAVKATDGQLQSEESVDGVDSGESAAAAGSASTSKSAKSGGAAAAAAAGVDLDGLPKPVARAIRKHKTLVLLFWNGKSVDDKAVHDAVKRVDRWNGRVYVGTAPIDKIAKYGRIARGVDVEQSPTVVVADRNLHAETLVGYVDKLTIDQAVVDAFRNTTGLFTDPYLRKIDAVCVHHSNAVAAVPNYYQFGSAKRFETRIGNFQRAWTTFVADFKAVKAPKKWRAFRTASVSDLDLAITHIHSFATAITPKSTPTEIRQAIATFNKAEVPVEKRREKRFDGKDLFRCGTAF